MMSTLPRSPSPSTRRWLALALLGLIVVALLAVVLPIGLLRPFRPQGPDDLARAYAVRRLAPGLTLAALAAAALAVWRLWRGARWPGRVGMTMALAILAGTVWLARFNVFEKMFAPLPRPGFVRAAAADFVAPADLVLAAEHGGDAVAWPVRQIAYHHVVMDEVGGTPVAVTY
jgi:hypothetical protein